MTEVSRARHRARRSSVHSRSDWMGIRVALFATLLLAACRGISFENEDAVEGMYSLRSVQSQPLPVPLADRTVAFTVTSGVLTLAPSGLWTEVLSGTTTENGQTVPKTLMEGGRYTLRNSNVEMMRSDSALAYSGSFSVSSGPKLELVRLPQSGTGLYTYAR